MTSDTLGTGVTGLSLDLLAERIDHEREMRETREDAAAEALRTATAALERRLEGMNEFRAALSEQSRSYVTTVVFDTKVDALGSRITLVERAAERASGAISTWRFLAGGSGILGIIALALALLHTVNPNVP